MKIFLLNSAIISLILALASMSNIAVAGLIENTENDSFIDKSTGLEWMDFGINNNHSFNYVASNLDVGEEYYGWTLASQKQVYEMWANAFLGLGSNFESPNFYGTGQLKVTDGFRKDGSTFSPILAVMGFNTIINFGIADTKASKGLFEGTNGLSFVEAKERVGMYTNWLDDDIVQVIDNNNYDNFKQNNDAEFSTMLIKINQVPEPSTFAIFLLAMFGIASRRLNKFS